jgi:hypothetical protein
MKYMLVVVTKICSNFSFLKVAYYRTLVFCYMVFSVRY